MKDKLSSAAGLWAYSELFPFMFRCISGIFPEQKPNPAANISWECFCWGKESRNPPLFSEKPSAGENTLFSPLVLCDISKEINTLFVCDIYKKLIIWCSCRFNSWEHTREGWTSDPDSPHDKCWLHPCLLPRNHCRLWRQRHRANGRELMWGSGKGNYPPDLELERLLFCQACDLDGSAHFKWIWGIYWM